MLLDPAAGGELADDGLVELAPRRVVDVLDARLARGAASPRSSARLIRLFSRCIHSASTSRPRRSSKDELRGVRLLLLLEPGGGHAVEPHRLQFLQGRFVEQNRVLLFSGSSRARARSRARATAGGRGRLGRREPVEAVLQDRLDVPVRPRAGGQGARARRLEPLGAVALAQPQDAEARAVALLGMRPLGEDRLRELRRLGPMLSAQLHDARRRPLQRASGGSSACARASSCAGRARSCARATSTRRSVRKISTVVARRPHVELLVHRAACTAPSSSGGRTRRGSRCSPSRPSTRRTRSAAAGSAPSAGRSSRSKSSRRLAPYTRIGRSFSSSSSSAIRALSSASEKKVWLRSRAEDPALRDLHADLDLRLVARVRRPRRQHHRAVVLRQLLVRALDPRLVAARRRHAALELVGHHRAAGRRRGLRARARGCRSSRAPAACSVASAYV